MAAALERALDSAAGLEKEEEEEEEEVVVVPGPVPVPLPVRVAAPAPVPVLVLGPAGSGRTSLLLRAALAGGAEGPRALYLAPSAPPRLPLAPGDGGNHPRALQRLELRYPPTLAALRRQLAALGASRPRPGLVLLDGLERYFPGGGPGGAGVARLASLLLQATQGTPPGTPPGQVLAALCLPPPSPQLLAQLRRFFPGRCRLRRVSPKGVSPGGPGVPPGLVRVRLELPGTPPRCWRGRWGPAAGGGGGGEGEEGEGEEGEGEEEEWGEGEEGDL